MPQRLELIERRPRGPRVGQPVLFLHGAFAGAWAWEEYFLPYFAAAGLHVYALSLRGHGASGGHESLDGTSVDDYVADMAQAIAQIGTPPAVVAHSMGGFVAQKYLEQGTLAALALVASTPPQGLVPVMTQLALRRPRLFSELNAFIWSGRASPDLVRQLLFAGPVDSARLARYCGLLQRESVRAMWDTSLFALPQVWRMKRPRLLFLGGERDELVPPFLVQLGAKSFGAEAEIFPGLGHALMLEAGWQAVAERLVAWLAAA